jgi:hypothetical protein
VSEERKVNQERAERGAGADPLARFDAAYRFTLAEWPGALNLLATLDERELRNNALCSTEFPHGLPKGAFIDELVHRVRAAALPSSGSAELSEARDLRERARRAMRAVDVLSEGRAVDPRIFVRTAKHHIEVLLAAALSRPSAASVASEGMVSAMGELAGLLGVESASVNLGGGGRIEVFAPPSGSAMASQPDDGTAHPFLNAIENNAHRVGRAIGWTTGSVEMGVRTVRGAMQPDTWGAAAPSEGERDIPFPTLDADPDAESDPALIDLDTFCSFCGHAHYRPGAHRNCPCSRHIDGGVGLRPSPCLTAALSRSGAETPAFDPDLNCPTHFAVGDPACPACVSKQHPDYRAAQRPATEGQV